MQDPTSTSIQGVKLVQYPEHEQLKCPRCYSTNTKFCYYNNYNLSQPRHFCKSCRRYWTKGGSLRNVPVGGGSRKFSSKRPNNRGNPYPTRQLQDNQTPSPVLTTSSFTATTSTGMDMEYGSGQDPTRMRGLEGLSFSSLLTSGQFGGGVNSGSGHDPSPRNGEGDNNCEIGGDGGGQEGGYLEGEEWENSNGWPDLAIFTPGSGFH